jgi:hypothetical protein
MAIWISIERYQVIDWTMVGMRLDFSAMHLLLPRWFRLWCTFRRRREPDHLGGKREFKQKKIKKWVGFRSSQRFSSAQPKYRFQLTLTVAS